ncbi:hypothetical protein EJ02DRAFT_1383 [Clathrospora elynae]|uniref:Uncharacterized protein n=1 Tax=Clathrospora elynae TaxID=706981 RepID=A0A6A5T648_9PLEO|nr:hypothetical protein EJ02DRAFT_1383 [Clathrospora elynae]
MGSAGFSTHIVLYTTRRSLMLNFSLLLLPTAQGPPATLPVHYPRFSEGPSRYRTFHVRYTSTPLNKTHLPLPLPPSPHKLLLSPSPPHASSPLVNTGLFPEPPEEVRGACAVEAGSAEDMRFSPTEPFSAATTIPAGTE